MGKDDAELQHQGKWIDTTTEVGCLGRGAIRRISHGTPSSEGAEPSTSTYATYLKKKACLPFQVKLSWI